jgi:hypothetical protein
MRKLTKSEEEIQKIIKERLLDFSDFNFINEVRFKPRGIVELKISVGIGTGHLYNKISKPEIVKEMIECCEFIQNYFDFLSLNITKINFYFDQSYKRGHFEFSCVFTKPVRTYKKKIIEVK